MNQIKFIVNAVKWRDRVNGNTYHSVRVIRCRDREEIYGQLTYGYGDSYRDTAKLTMLRAGWIPKKYRDNLYLYERENDYPIYYSVTYGTKRECKKNGII